MSVRVMADSSDGDGNVTAAGSLALSSEPRQARQSQPDTHDIVTGSPIEPLVPGT
jgi:hypothetical protein